MPTRTAMKEMLPVSLEEAILDYEILETVEEGGMRKYEVSVACVSKQVLYTPFNFLCAAGIMPTKITTPICALEHLLKVLPSHPGSTTPRCLLRIGGDDSQILVFQDHRPVLWRQVLLGTRKSSPEPAATEPKPDLPAAVHKTAFLRDLVREIQRTMDHYFEESQGISIKEVLLLGGEDHDPAALSLRLAEQLGLPVNVGDPLRGLTILPECPQDPAVLKGHSQEFALAIGAALSADSKINLLPQEIKHVTPRFYRRVGVIAGITVSLTLLGFLLPLLRTRIRDLQAQAAALAIELQALAPQLVELERRESLQALVGRRRALLANLDAQRMPLDQALKEISNVLPRQVVLREWKFLAGEIILKGEIRSQESAAELILGEVMRKLDQGIFRDIKLIQAVKEEGEETLPLFEVSCEFDAPSSHVP